MKNSSGSRALLGGRLHQLDTRVTPGSDLLYVSRIVADMDQAEASQESVAFGNNQNIVAAGEKRDAFPGDRSGGVAEKLRGNLKRRRRGRQLWPHKPLHRLRNKLHRTLLRSRRRCDE